MKGMMKPKKTKKAKKQSATAMSMKKAGITSSQPSCTTTQLNAARRSDHF